VEKVAAAGARFGMEVSTAEGYDNVGTYAFFKAYRNLPKGLDAVYISPLWGMTATEIGAFMEMASNDRIAVFSSEGGYPVKRGALASRLGNNLEALARGHAFRAIKIVQGAVPADLPVTYQLIPGLILNEGTARRCRVTFPEAIRIRADIVRATAPAGAERYDPELALLQAMAANPGYQAQVEAMQAAEHAADEAWAEYLPHLALIGQAVWVDDNTVANFGGRMDNSHFRADFLLSQRLFSMSTINDIKAARKRRELASELLVSQALDLQVAVLAAYLNYLKAGELLEVVSNHRQLVDRMLSLAQARAVLGEADSADVIRWRLHRHRVTLHLIDVEANLKVARTLFNLLLSQPAETPLHLEPIAAEEQFVSEFLFWQPLVDTEARRSRALDYFVDRSREDNPSLKAQRRRAELAGCFLSGNTARYYPEVGFWARLGFQDELVNSPPAFEEKSRTWSAGARFDLPLFLGTERISERARLTAGRNQAEYSRDNAELAVIARVRTVGHRLLACLSDVPLVMDRLTGAEAYRENLSDLYLSGRRPLADMIDALKATFECRLDAVAVRYDYWMAASDLTRAIGWPLVDQPSSPGQTLAGWLNGQLGTGR
jgi:outer membrane protein TolC